MGEEELPLREAAQRFGVSLARLRRAAWDGRLAARFLGHQYLVTASEVERFLREKGHQPAEAKRSTPGEGAAMTRIIAVAVPKGGTGKTTTALNLGAAWAEQGKRVLLVDFDPQGSLTLALGLRANELEHTIYSALKYFLATFESQIELAIRPTDAGVDLVPANIRLNLANEELAVAPQRELVLQKLLAPIVPRYDAILIDTLPYLGILVVNALVAAQEVIIPLQADYLATESVTLMLQQIQYMRRSGLNPDLEVCGILLTQVKGRTVLNRQFIDFARQELGSRVPVFETMIADSIQFGESQAQHLSILQYSPNREGARTYRALAEEVWRATS